MEVKRCGLDKFFLLASSTKRIEIAEIPYMKLSAKALYESPLR